MTSLNKNILLLIPTFADEGGTQKMVCELGSLLSERYNVFECSFDAFNEPHVFKNGNKVLSLESKHAHGIGKIFGYVKKARHLRRIKRENKIDIVISNLWSADVVNALADGHEKKIFIGHVNIVGNSQNRALLRWKKLASLIYRRADKVVAVNAQLQEELKELFDLQNEQVLSIANFVSLPNHPPVTIPRAGGRRRLVNFGRLNPIKNHKALIKLFSQVKLAIGNVQLVIIGAGPLHQELVEFCSELRLTVSTNAQDDADVIFTGFHADPYSVLCSSDLFVFTSTSEGFGLVLVEAMHAGLPIVTSDCPTGGPHFIMQGKDQYEPGRKEPEITAHGYLMPVPGLQDEKSLQQWQNVIIDLLCNDEKRMQLSRLSKTRALDFSKERIKGQWFELIEQL
jgi:glycosyltransferase involved in cell wall biosynthesis